MANSGKIKSLCVFTLALAGCALWAQAPGGDTPAAPPVAYASVNELNTILAQIQQAAKSIDGDLSKTHIEKWKVDSATKRDVQGNVDSIRRNIQTALPEMITQLTGAPEDLGASFKLYRNLDALYDVFGPVAESAGAFGSKDEYQNLSNDLTALQNARHALGERMQTLATAKETELARLRNQLRAAQAAPPAPPKKVIVDDTEPPKKPVKKKVAKPVAPAAAAPAAAAPATTPK